MSDTPTPKQSKLDRATLIVLLQEAGKKPAEISFTLTMEGHVGLTAEEVKALTPALTKDAIAAAAVATTKDKVAKQGDKPTKPHKEMTPADQADAVTAALTKVVGKKGDKQVKQIDAMVTAMAYQLVDCMRVLHPDLYAKYREIKYPGGVEDLATDATKREAYLFAFASMLDAHKV